MNFRSIIFKGPFSPEHYSEVSLILCKFGPHIKNSRIMKYHPIDSSLFVKNRRNFMASMDPDSIAVFNSNDIYPISADSTMPFQQARDLFYLSGVDQEKSILVLFRSEEHTSAL